VLQMQKTHDKETAGSHPQKSKKSRVEKRGQVNGVSYTLESSSE
jgi:hypothetical protein